jgi:hypothetical protein
MWNESKFHRASTQFKKQARQDFAGEAAQKDAAYYMEELEAMKMFREIEKELIAEHKAAVAEKERESKRIQDAYLRETDSLEQQIVLLRDGKEAARAMAMEKQGIAKEDAKRFVEMQRQLEEQERLGQSMGPSGVNSAQESRVMARGDVDQSPMIDTAKNTEESKKILDQMLTKLGDLVQKTDQAKGGQLFEMIAVGE